MRCVHNLRHRTPTEETQDTQRQEARSQAGSNGQEDPPSLPEVSRRRLDQRTGSLGALPKCTLLHAQSAYASFGQTSCDLCTSPRTVHPRPNQGCEVNRQTLGFVLQPPCENAQTPPPFGDSIAGSTQAPHLGRQADPQPICFVQGTQAAYAAGCSRLHRPDKLRSVAWKRMELCVWRSRSQPTCGSLVHLPQRQSRQKPQRLSQLPPPHSQGCKPRVGPYFFSTPLQGLRVQHVWVQQSHGIRRAPLGSLSPMLSKDMLGHAVPTAPALQEAASVLQDTWAASRREALQEDLALPSTSQTSSQETIVLDGGGGSLGCASTCGSVCASLLFHGCCTTPRNKLCQSTISRPITWW